MSKIGKINIEIPEKVKVSLEGSLLKMEGPLGKNNLALDVNLFELKINEGKEVLPKGPSILRMLPLRITFTLSGIVIFIFPIFDIKTPYK